ncbi:MAG: hypothetical protein WCO00_03010 [Rhodospirillaceae bacterium]
MTAAAGRAVAGLIGLWLALALGGCAGIGAEPGGSRTPAREAAWLGFFSGEDLRAQCENGGLDAFRLVWRRADARFRVLEVIGNEAGGALMIHHEFSPEELARGEPPAEPPGPRQRLPLSPDGFTGLIYWFDRLGLFTPVPGAPGQPGAALEWLISGCLGGNRILNVHLPAAGETGDGVPTRATPAASGPGVPDV